MLFSYLFLLFSIYLKRCFLPSFDITITERLKNEINFSFGLENLFKNVNFCAKKRNRMGVTDLKITVSKTRSKKQGVENLL